MSPGSDAGAGLQARRLTLRRPRADFDAVRDLTLQVRPGEVLALVGPNGSGKSTLLSGLAGTLAPRSGTVTLDGRAVSEWSARERAQRLALLPQAPSAPEGVRVVDLVRTGRFSHRARFSALGRDDRRAVHEAIQLMDLDDLRHRKVERLSGGERRRAWLAMVLAQGTDWLLLDEPTAALDLRHEWEVLAHVSTINRERGTSIVVALHDLAQAAQVAHRVAVLSRGRIYHVGDPASALDDDTLRDVFRVDAELEKDDGRMRLRLRGPADPTRNL